MKSKTLYINYESRVHKMLDEKWSSFITGVTVFAVSAGLLVTVVVKNAYMITSLAQAKKAEKGNVLSLETKKKAPVKAETATPGNITEKAASTTQVTFKGNKYTVKEGESLSDVAQKVYGDIAMWPRIQQANNIFNPDIVPAGTVLVIPR